LEQLMAAFSSLIFLFTLLTFAGSLNPLTRYLKPLLLRSAATTD